MNCFLNKCLTTCMPHSTLSTLERFEWGMHTCLTGAVKGPYCVTGFRDCSIKFALLRNPEIRRFGKVICWPRTLAGRFVVSSWWIPKKVSRDSNRRKHGTLEAPVRNQFHGRTMTMPSLLVFAILPFPQRKGLSWWKHSLTSENIEISSK